MSVVQTEIALQDRISPVYQAIQREMHESLSHYGKSSERLLGTLRQVIEDHKITSVLDYGCGKGNIKPVLGDIVVEYDPGIPGKEEDPDVCDLVFCTDVLEHIEPDKLVNVLEHIRQKCRRCAVFLIATRPASKNLPDGRNAHLIIENAEWWRDKLSVGFDIQQWEVDPESRGVVAVARPYLLIGQIEGVGVMSNDDRFDQIKQNVKLTDKRVTVRKGVFYSTPVPTEDMPIEKMIPLFSFPAGPHRDKKGNLGFRWAIPKPHNRVAIVMCYGPSLEDTWQTALVERAAIDKADIVSVSGAHDYLIDRGVIPRYHIECDPRKHKGDMITKPHRKVGYLMASCVHPEVLAKLKGFDLTLWHMNNGKGSDRVIEELEPNCFLVPGGGSVGLRGLVLLYVMGYRRFIIHGMDCSYRGERSHAGAHTGKKIPPVEVSSEGKKFLTAPVLITYMRYFEENMRRHIGDANTDPSKIEIILRGDGLLQHWLKAGGAATSGDMPTSEAA